MPPGDPCTKPLAKREHFIKVAKEFNAVEIGYT
jgi:hypothetical protein